MNKEIKKFNYKIPYIIAQNSKLSPLAKFVFAELNAMYQKTKYVWITDKSLAARWHKSISAIQRSLHQLKEANYLVSVQLPDRRGRTITIKNIPLKDNYILIPNVIKVKGYDTKVLTLSELLFYGYLYSTSAKQNLSKSSLKSGFFERLERAKVSLTNQELAIFFGCKIRLVQRNLKALEKAGCISKLSQHGVGLEIEINQMLLDDPDKNVSAYKTESQSVLRNKVHEKNAQPPMSKMLILHTKFMSFLRSQTCQKRATNIFFNLFNLINIEFIDSETTEVSITIPQSNGSQKTKAVSSENSPTDDSKFQSLISSLLNTNSQSKVKKTAVFEDLSIDKRRDVLEVQHERYKLTNRLHHNDDDITQILKLLKKGLTAKQISMYIDKETINKA